MQIGTLVFFDDTIKVEGMFDRLTGFGFKTCQIVCWAPNAFTEEKAVAVKREMEAKGVKPSGLWAGYSGRVCWNFTEGPVTLGLVPYTYRAQRIAELKKAADFAKVLGVKAIITHCGFIPENMTDSNYQPVVEAIREVASYCKERGLEFWFETGQETPVVLLRTIELVGTGNLGINLDPANLLLYGKGNPIDALEVFGKYVRNIHAKDGRTPTDGSKLGHETKVGEGMVRYPEFIRRLKAVGFDGEMIIEREIPEGEEQSRDIRDTAANLQKWWNEA